ncbi:glycoside hydrolase family 31 (plasmid) [Sphingopyxis sp. EG6]|nr:glycoside hydrolase family 31 [Sphingopyxis sp. EG6]
MKYRNLLGTESTHWRTGRRGKTWSLRCAAVSTIRRVVHEGQTPRPLQEKATKGSVANSDTVSKIGLMYCQGQLR